MRYKIFLLVMVVYFNQFSNCYSQCDLHNVVVLEDGVCPTGVWHLVFNDEFDGTTLDLTKWTPVEGVVRDFVHAMEKQWYSPNNITVGGGVLKITAKAETVTGTYVTDWSTVPPTTATETFNYTSGEIDSKYKFGYGKYEIRCKLADGKGFFPAFWMYGEDAAHVNNEIDVFEFINEHNPITGAYLPAKNAKVPHLTCHYNGEMCGAGYTTGDDYAGEYHIFTVVWDPYKIVWSIDGEDAAHVIRLATKFYTLGGGAVDCHGVSDFTAYKFNDDFPLLPALQIIADFAIQSGSDAPDGTTPFPSSLLIDYIRYYEQLPCANTVYIDDISDLNLGAAYNIIVGNTIYVSSSVTLLAGMQLELAASDIIILDPGFNVDPGADFVAHLRPDICPDTKALEPNSSNTTSENKSLNVSESEKPSSIKYYPNPTSGMLTVEFDSNGLTNEIFILDMNGKTIFSRMNVVENKTDLNISELSNGLYYIKVVNSEKTYINKLVKN